MKPRLPFYERIATRLDEQQKKAIDSDCNTVVSAGAGSGKTTVLSYRYLRLLYEEKADVSSILTLTFTRKAAAEMYERIHTHLLAHKDDPVIQKQLSKFDQAHISTLDAFCAQIVRSGAVYYGIPSDFTQDDETCRTLAEDTALEVMLEEGDHPGLIACIELFSFDRVLQDLLIPLASQHMIPFQLEGNYIEAETQLAHLHRELSMHQRELQSIAGLILELPAGSSATIKNARQSMIQCIEVIFPAALEGHFEEALKGLESLPAWNSPRKNAKQEELKILRDVAQAWKYHLSMYTLLVASLAQAETCRAIASFLELFRTRYIRKKRAAGVLTFSDVSNLAIDILIKQKDIRDYYKQAFRYIMIDEFQDNDIRQKQLLYLLAEKSDCFCEGIPSPEQLEQDKLFFVGDEKQSIYKFRGADVSVFKALKGELEAYGGTSLILETNYRSEPGLIEFFNGLFPSIMMPSAEPFEATFQPLGYRAPVPGLEPQIQLFIGDSELPAGEASGEVPRESESQDKNNGQDASESQGENSGEEEEYLRSVESEAWFLARKILAYTRGETRQLEQQGQPLWIKGTDGNVRLPEFKDFAILLRSTSNQIVYEKALRATGIPYQVQSARALFLEAPVNDIYQLLQLVVYPQDRHAYAGYLRSPFGNISDETFLRLMLHPAKEPFSMSLKELDLEEDDPEAVRLRQLAILYEKTSHMADCVPITTLLRFIWYEAGYRLLLLKKPEYQMYLEYYAYLHAIAARFDARGEALAGFLDFLRVRLGNNEKVPELELLQEQNEGVQIMTIHKSKGLEFPIVILANAGNTGANTQEPLFYFPENPLSAVGAYAEAGSGPTVKFLQARKVLFDSGTDEAKPKQGNAANYFYARDYLRNKAKETAELKRLLYVGMTRAESHLIISGVRTAKNRGEGSETKNLLSMVLQAAGIDDSQLAALHGGDSSQIYQKQGITLEAIPALTEEDIRKQREHLAAVHDIGTVLQTFLQLPGREYFPRRKLFSATELQELEQLQLHSGNTGEASAAPGFQSAPGEDSFTYLPSLEADSLIGEYSREFGTYCHKIIENCISSEIFAAAGMPNQAEAYLEVLDSLVLPSISFGAFSESQEQILQKDAKMLAGNFFQSTFWSELILEPSLVCESEVPFIFKRDDGILVRGDIDLLAAGKEWARVIDFKTDKVFAPEQYRCQVTSYLEAAEALLELPVEAFVFYLRSKGNHIWHIKK